MNLANGKNGGVHLVEVRLKAEYADAEGEAALQQLHGLGVTAAKELRTSRLYLLKGPLTVTHVQAAARDLLTDPVTQEFKILAPASAPVSNGMSHWRVEVWLKPTVSDPAGDTVREALAEMGLPEPSAVRVGTAYRIVGRVGRHQLEKAVLRSLANPVVHRVTIAETHP